MSVALSNGIKFQRGCSLIKLAWKWQPEGEKSCNSSSTSNRETAHAHCHFYVYFHFLSKPLWQWKSSFWSKRRVEEGDKGNIFKQKQQVRIFLENWVVKVIRDTSSSWWNHSRRKINMFHSVRLKNWNKDNDQPRASNVPDFLTPTSEVGLADLAWMHICESHGGPFSGSFSVKHKHNLTKAIPDMTGKNFKMKAKGRNPFSPVN